MESNLGFHTPLSPILSSQFDTSATAVIMTKIQNKDKYMKLMNGVEIIESRYCDAVVRPPLSIFLVSYAFFKILFHQGHEIAMFFSLPVYTVTWWSI